MTNNQLTKEWLQQTIAELEYVRDEIPFGIDTNSELELAAFKIALAAMDSEPVAYWRKALRADGFCYADGINSKRFHDENPPFPLEDGDYWEIIPLYRHAQSAPVVVPDGLRLALSNAGIAAPESDELLAATCEKHIQALVTWVKDRKPFQPAPVVPGAYVRDERGAMMLNGKCEPRIGFGEGWNACRAAMLQAEPVTTTNKLGNSPVIPDTWIPVSERNPDDIGRYWCYVEEQNSLGKSHYQWNCSWNGEIWGGAMMYGLVTHWMPLPNPPKEEN